MNTTEKVRNKWAHAKNVRKAFSIRGNLETDIPDSCPWELAETITLDAFENPDELNFSFKEEFQPMDGFEPMQFDKVGLYRDAFRQNPPSKTSYRTAIKKRFEGIPSSGGRYNIKTVNQRYPAPAYLD